MDNNISLKTIWGIAKSPELHLTDEELHLVVYAQVKKDSLKLLTNRDMKIVIGVLTSMKDSASRAVGSKRHSEGRYSTENQRKKVYRLTEQLGWESELRINGLCKKMFNVGSVKKLSYTQCSNLIEALKKMLERVQNGEKE